MNWQNTQRNPLNNLLGKWKDVIISVLLPRVLVIVDKVRRRRIQRTDRVGPHPCAHNLLLFDHIPYGAHTHTLKEAGDCYDRVILYQVFFYCYATLI